MLGQNQPIFVGGLPRSGTSLMVKLLDDHSQLRCLPRECTAITHHYFNKLESASFDDLESSLSEFQLFSQNEIKSIGHHLNEDMTKWIDCDAARSSLVEYLSKNGMRLSLVRILDALSLALDVGFSEKDFGKSKVFKMPFYCEYLFPELKASNPHSKLIIVERA